MTAQEITNVALQEKLLIIAAGSKVIRIVPPLIIKRSEIKQLLKKLEATFERIAN